MMHFQCEQIRLFSGDCTEALCFGIAANSKRNVFRKQMSCFCRCQPLRLWRLPVEEVEIRILLVNRRWTVGTLFLQSQHDEPAFLFIESVPHLLARPVAVLELRHRCVLVPKINEYMFLCHKYQISNPVSSVPALQESPDYVGVWTFLFNFLWLLSFIGFLFNQASNDLLRRMLLSSFFKSNISLSKDAAKLRQILLTKSALCRKPILAAN